MRLGSVLPFHPSPWSVSTQELTISQSHTVPVQSARCLISTMPNQRVNKPITEGFCKQDGGKEIQSKQINVPARVRNFLGRAIRRYS